MDTELYKYKKDELEKLKKEYKEQLSSLKYSALGFVGFGGICAAAYNMFKGIPQDPLDTFMACGIFALLCGCAGSEVMHNVGHASGTKKKIKRLERELE